MKKSRFSEAQILGILRQQDQGLTVAQICREHSLSEATFYTWKRQYGGMNVSGAVNSDVFAAYLAHALGPTLVPGDVVVLDNQPAHKVVGLAEIVAARGGTCCICRPIRPILIPSNPPSANSNLAAHGPGPHPRGIGKHHPSGHRVDKSTGCQKLV